jgi:hypothetical protein
VVVIVGLVGLAGELFLSQDALERACRITFFVKPVLLAVDLSIQFLEGAFRDPFLAWNR